MRGESEGMRGTMESFSGPLRAILGQFLEEMREGERAFERDDGAYALLCPSGPFLILDVVSFISSPIHLLSARSRPGGAGMIPLSSKVFSDFLR